MNNKWEGGREGERGKETEVNREATGGVREGEEAVKEEEKYRRMKKESGNEK